MTTRPQPPCPECEKLAAASEESNVIGEFLNWLARQDIVLAEWNDYSEELQRADFNLSDRGINEVLAEYYGIDLDIVEKERRALLDWIREVQGVG